MNLFDFFLSKLIISNKIIIIIYIYKSYLYLNIFINPKFIMIIFYMKKKKRKDNRLFISINN